MVLFYISVLDNKSNFMETCCVQWNMTYYCVSDNNAIKGRDRWVIVTNRHLNEHLI